MSPSHLYGLAIIAVVFFACGDDSHSADSENDDPSHPFDIPDGPRDYTGPIGGDRPVEPTFPDDYDPEGNHPLLIQLHGYGSDAAETEAGFQTMEEANQRGVVVLSPEGEKNANDDRFWNATDFCCDLGSDGIDDVGYLTTLIEDAVYHYAIDPEQIFMTGISNGGFMSHRMACERGDYLRGILSFNGSSFYDEDDCAADHPVQIIHVHGTDDDVVQYDGAGSFYPGAREVVERWADANGCDPDPVEGPRVNVTAAVEGDETVIEQWQHCVDGGEVELWTMEGADHVPTPVADFPTLLFDVFLEH